MQPIDYRNEGVGKFLSTSKIRHTWNFKIHGKDHKVEFFDSKMSGNFQVMLDGSTNLYKGNNNGKDKQFVYDFDINGVNLQIRNTGNGYELFSNGKGFQYLLKNPSMVSAFQPANDMVFQQLLQDGLKRGFSSPHAAPVRTNSVDKSIPGNPTFPPSKNRSISEYAHPSQGIPIAKGIIDPNKLLANASGKNYPAHPSNRSIRIQGNCVLEGRGDYFMEIDFPNTDSSKQAVYLEVHRRKFR